MGIKYVIPRILGVRRGERPKLLLFIVLRFDGLFNLHVTEFIGVKDIATLQAFDILGVFVPGNDTYSWVFTGGCHLGRNREFRLAPNCSGDLGHLKQIPAGNHLTRAKGVGMQTAGHGSTRPHNCTSQVSETLMLRLGGGLSPMQTVLCELSHESCASVPRAAAPCMGRGARVRTLNTF